MSFIKILFIGDPHFKIKNVEYIPLFISKIVGIVESNTLDFIVVAGDLLDNHDKIDVEPYNLALNFIAALSKTHKTFVIVGNHDYKNTQQFLSTHHWMNALKQWNNVTIVDNIAEYAVCPLEGDDGLRFLFVPYVAPGRFAEAIETKISLKDIQTYRVVFAHQEFYKCKMGAIESKQGDKWDEDWPLVISGHIHDKQWSQKNIYYPGSAMQHAFGQSSENTVSIITCPLDSHVADSVQEIDLGMPKLTIKYLDVNDAMKPLKFDNTEFRRYKIVLRGSQEEFQSFKRNVRYKQLLEQGFKITFKLRTRMNEECNIVEHRKKFLEVLQEKIKNENDPDLERIFYSLI